MSPLKKTYLLIFDGLGLAPPGPGNAVRLAKAPFLHKLLYSSFPSSQLTTHGAAVGLPDEQTGGSEVGHLTIGSGRVIPTPLRRINDAISTGDYARIPALQNVLRRAKSVGRLHLLGMASDGGVHSYLPHLWALVDAAREAGIDHIYNHLILDGRDVAERSAAQYLSQMDMHDLSIDSLGGRFTAMDRDQNWSRTHQYYQLLTDSQFPLSVHSPLPSLQNYYQAQTTSDYYFPPTLFNRQAQLQPEDTVICWNFRTDRLRQLSAALCSQDFSFFVRPWVLNLQNYGVHGDYCSGAETIFSFANRTIPNTLAEVVSQAQGRQLRLAETEKFNHVTFFLNAEKADPFPGEDRIMIPSLKSPNYAKTPAMSADQLTTQAMKSVSTQNYDLIIQNYANPDLVGHSGDLQATIRAIETIDQCLSRLVPHVLQQGYQLLITSDHGNAEQMLFPDGQPCPSHSKFVVPAILVSDDLPYQMRPQGTLADIAPTICQLLGLSVPADMTGSSLLIHPAN